MADLKAGSHTPQVSAQLSETEQAILKNSFSGLALSLLRVGNDAVVYKAVDARQFEFTVGRLIAIWYRQPQIAASAAAAEHLHSLVELMEQHASVFTRLTEARRKTVKNLFGHVCNALTPLEKKRIKGVIQGGEIEKTNHEKRRQPVRLKKPKSKPLPAKPQGV